MEEIIEDLCDSIDKNNLEKFQDLLEKYPNLINYESQFGWSLLMYSVDRKRNKIIRILMRLGANVDHKNCEKNSILWMSVVRKYYEISEFLLESGANANIQNDFWRWTALHKAVSDHDVSMVEMLLGYGADIHIRDINGTTPLDLAKTDEMRDILLSGVLPGPKRAEK